MSKIKIKSELISKKEKHIYEGSGIKNNNQIIYHDHGILTKITLKDIITIERKKDYSLKLGFKTNTKQKGTYIISEGTLETETETSLIKITENSIKIKYKLTINNEYVDTFEFNLKFTIDR